MQIRTKAFLMITALLTTTQPHRSAKICQKMYSQIKILKLSFIADTSLTGATSPFSKQSS